jgi:hypothetical protein
MAAKITTVNTPTALKLALDRGAEHIEITQHLDLTTLPSSVGSPNNDPDLFRPLPNTRTIRVRSHLTAVMLFLLRSQEDPCVEVLGISKWTCSRV